MENEGKEDDAKKLITSLNDLLPVLAPDASNTSFTQFQKGVQEQIIPEASLINNIDSNTNKRCGQNIPMSYKQTIPVGETSATW